VKWPPACKDVSPGAQERLRLNQLRVGDVISEMVGKDPEFRGKRTSSVEAATKQRLLKT
jgi:hypothetical protein